MESNEFVYSKLSDMSVTLKTQPQKNMTLLRGKAVINEEDKNMMFLQNEPRGPRSKEVWRTEHSRVVVRPDGDYTLTFRFSKGMPYLKSVLIAELRDAIDGVLNNGNVVAGQKGEK